MMAFWRDQKGSVATTVAVSAMILIMIVGAVIDFGTSIYVRSNLQNAVDAAALAAGKADPVVDQQGVPKVAETQEAFRVLAQNMFNANNRVSKLATADPVKVIYTAPVGLTPDTVLVSLSARMPTTFLSIFGIGSLDIAIESKSQRPQPGPIDLALALDTTGSMKDPPASGGEPKLTTLKSAATDLVNKLMSNGNPNIEIAVVPYSSYVFIGVTTPTPQWIFPIDKVANFCTKRATTNCTTTRYDCLIDGILTKEGCSTTNCPCLEFQGSTIYPWNGCVGARSPLFPNNPTAPILNKNFTDAYLNTIKNLPSQRPSSESDKIPVYAGMSDASAPSGTCGSKILPMTTNKDAVLASINSLKAVGETHIPSGLIWGWNALDPAEPLAARTVDDLKKIGGRKVLLLMTDGINSTSPRLQDGPYLPNGNVSITLPWRDGSKSNDLTRQVCDNIKNDGIQIFTVLFDVPEGSITETDLTNCASSPDMAFKASNRDGLLKAFSNITDQLKTLKIVQ